MRVGATFSVSCFLVPTIGGRDLLEGPLPAIDGGPPMVNHQIGLFDLVRRYEFNELYEVGQGASEVFDVFNVVGVRWL
jgi:hypothetical protein